MFIKGFISSNGTDLIIRDSENNQRASIFYTCAITVTSLNCRPRLIKTTGNVQMVWYNFIICIYIVLCIYRWFVYNREIVVRYITFTIEQASIDTNGLLKCKCVDIDADLIQTKNGVNCRYTYISEIMYSRGIAIGNP
jgi:hypothetical protein